MILYTKKIEDIEYDDVVNFCNEEIRENVNLDYKEDFNVDNKKLAATISAFANTFGGLVIIGVKDKDGVPELPAEGVKYERGLSERITKIILDNIYPPIFPDVRVCKNEDESKAFVIIRIHPSDSAPHAIRGNTKAYLRINDLKNPEELATIEQIDWLRNKREKSRLLKGELVEEARERHKEPMYDPSENNSIVSNIVRRRTPFGHGFFYSIPIFPSQPMSDPDKLKEIIEKIEVSDSFRGGKFLGPSFRKKFISNGIVVKEDNDLYVEFNNFGLFYYGENFMLPIEDLEKVFKERTSVDFEVIREDKTGYFNFWLIISRIDLFLEFAYKFYKEIGYWGYINIFVTLKDTDRIFLFKEEDFIKDSVKKSLDYEMVWKKEIMIQELKDKRIELIEDYSKNLFWCYGYQITSELDGGLITEYLKRNNRIDINY